MLKEKRLYVYPKSKEGKGLCWAGHNINLLMFKYSNLLIIADFQDKLPISERTKHFNIYYAIN